MRNIVLARIDERLIHGQIATSWLKIKTNPNTILIVDDKLVNDSLQTRLLNVVAGQLGVTCLIKNVQDAAAWLKEEPEADQNVLVMAKTPIPFLKLIEEGITFSEIILGNMGMGPGRKRFNRNISASAEEVQAFRDIVAKGVPIYYQMVPSDPKKNIDSLL